MSKFGSKEEILASIHTLFENIGSGKLTADEMESLVALTRELHERALILRYKSYEEQIFGVAPEKSDTHLETIPQPVEAVDTPEIREEEEVQAPAESIFAAAPVQADEQPVFDFAMFEEAEKDLFVPETHATTPANDVTPVETPETDRFANIPQPGTHSVSDQDLAIGQQETIQAEEEIPLPEELAIMNEPVIIPEPEVHAEDIFRNVKYSSGHGSSLMSPKLSTLVGSFGLNERLQCIQELFKGSGEAFNQAIELLDKQESFAAAKRILAQYAQQNNWNLESNLTAEFLQKIERRFL